MNNLNEPSLQRPTHELAVDPNSLYEFAKSIVALYEFRHRESANYATAYEETMRDVAEAIGI